MKRLCITIIAALSFGVLGLAAGIDGTWTGKAPRKGKNGEPDREVAATLTLRSEGNKLTGTMNIGRGRKSAEIKDGTVEGERIAFTTTATAKKKGEVTMRWIGKVTGDELTLSREGRKKRTAQIVLKRQG